jgi:hypothetical protein
VSASAVAVAILAFLIAATAEEIGWSAFLTEPLAQRVGDRLTGVVVGPIWAVWHVVPLLQAGHSLWWIGWWAVFTVAQRIMMMRISAGAGRSVSIMIVFHASANVAYALLPNGGSRYDPMFVAPIVAVIAVMITACWGHRSVTDVAG